MVKKYKPEYATGKIWVRFKREFDSEHFTKPFIESYGYSLLDLDESLGYSAIQVPEGQEKNAIRKLSRQKKFIEWAERMDLKYEQRIKNLDSFLEEVTEFRDELGSQSDQGYEMGLMMLKKRIEEYQQQELKRQR
jgi:hypothetical protein